MLFLLCADFDPTDCDTDPILPDEAREPIDPDADWETLEELIAPSIQGGCLFTDEDCDDVIADLADDDSSDANSEWERASARRLR